MEAIGADANLSSEAEFPSIGEAGASVPVDAGAVDLGEEGTGRLGISGKDSVGMT